jgi:L-ascorbate metabolism protein UlaG (beta-lactamase superfamily)
MDILGLDIEWHGHDCFEIKVEKIIYFDPYQLGQKKLDTADLILITHEHFDHCSSADVKKIADKDTIVVASEQCKTVLAAVENFVRNIFYMKPGQKKDFFGISVEAVPAYNINKFQPSGVPFHPKADGKNGYVVTIAGRRVYHAGDTDFIPEMRELKNIDIAFLPVSGTYVMTAQEAAEAAQAIKPKVVIPMHFGTIIGSRADAERFAYLAKGIEVKILG